MCVGSWVVDKQGQRERVGWLIWGVGASGSLLAFGGQSARVEGFEGLWTVAFGFDQCEGRGEGVAAGGDVLVEEHAATAG